MKVAARMDDWCDDCILEVESMLAEAEESHAATVEEYEPRYDSYDMEDLEQWISVFEDEYGIPSCILYAMAQENMRPVNVPGRDCSAWLSFYREYLELKLQ